MIHVALKLALEALEPLVALSIEPEDLAGIYKALTAIKEALEQPEPEPVAYGMWDTMIGCGGRMMMVRLDKGQDGCTVPLYTSPPKREWQGLTDQEVMVCAYQAGFDIHEDYENEDDPEAMHWWTPDGEACDDSLLKLRDLIEAKLKEKNHG